jgi:hypothetical protein
MGWFKNLVSDLTGDSTSKSAEAGHDFRDDSGAREDKDMERFEKAPDWAELARVSCFLRERPADLSLFF